MMAEGGAEAIENMFQGIPLKHQKMLDIGSGLGGCAFYLAKNYDAHVTGVEISPWMVEESKRRTPTRLRNLSQFVLIQADHVLPFADNTFDIVYSKGVLTHVAQKEKIFKEMHRVLKPNGKLVIEDWLSPKQGEWGNHIQEMAASEGLILFAETENRYQSLLKATGFGDIHMRSESEHYAQYNREIAHGLNTDRKAEFEEKFGAGALKSAAHGYTKIAQAIEENELLIRHFEATKV